MADIPNEYTLCETYGDYTIVIRHSRYSAFRDGQPVSGTAADTRANTRRLIDALPA